MIISFKGNTGGGGGYVLPTATDTRLGGVKVGSGLTVQNDGTLSADGGAGGGDYIVTEALSSITNPTEGMIAYVPAHYEDRGATHIKFELIDTSENVDLWYPDFLYFDNDWNKWEKIQAYYFDATNNENTRAEFRKDDGFRKTELISSDAWFSPSLASQVLVKVSGATIEFLVDSGLTISGTQNPDNKFNITTSTALTPVRGMTYIYHSGWILKDVDFAYDRFADYMPSCLSLIKNRSNEQELGFGLWGINFDTKHWFNIDAEGQPLGWGGFSFSCLSTEDDTQIKYEVFVETDGSSWNPNARITNMKPLDFIRIPVLAEDAVLTEDIEYDGQIVAHSGDTVASAGTIVAETDLYSIAAYGHETYGKNRVIFVFVQSGDCSWNSEQQKVIVNEGPGLDAYGDLQNIHRVAVEGEPEDYYISATMDYNGTLYRGSWKQHDRYTRWITLSWTPIKKNTNIVYEYDPNNVISGQTGNLFTAPVWHTLSGADLSQYERIRVCINPSRHSVGLSTDNLTSALVFEISLSPLSLTADVPYYSGGITTMCINNDNREYAATAIVRENNGEWQIALKTVSLYGASSTDITNSHIYLIEGLYQ